MTQAPSADPRLLVENDGPLVSLTLNRPAKLNAIDPVMLQALDDALQEIDRDPSIRVLLLLAAGDRAFSVGADIHAWAALGPLDMWRSWVRQGHRVFDRLASLRQPTIAVINGYAFGGGLELALATDLRLAADHAEFAMPETTLGTLPGWAGTRRLPNLIGVSRTKQMILTGARLDAVTAERWGLVNEITPAPDLRQRAADLAHTIAANAPVAVQLAKAAIDGAPPTLEAIAGALAATSADAREGLAAFRARRPPTFEGH